MAFSQEDERQKYGFNDKGKDETFVPVVSDVKNVGCFFKGIINESYEDAMKTRDQHCANRDQSH